MDIKNSRSKVRKRSSHIKKSDVKTEALQKKQIKLEGDPLPKRQKITELGNIIRSFTRSPSPSTSEVHFNTTDQWIDKYVPEDLASVAIHSRKLKDVKEQLQTMLRYDSTIKLLVLTGPAGASKSTIVKRLAIDLIPHEASSQSFIEWLNPLETYPAQFQDFLSSVKYKTGRNLALILIEDIPNVFHEETRKNFQQSILEWIHTEGPLPPLVICITECDFAQDDDSKQGFNIENNFTAETVLGRKILNNIHCFRIKFNPVNTLLIKKCLKNIVIKESAVFANISKSLIDEKIIELSTAGDIRAAISTFQFWAQWKVNNDIDGLEIGKESSLSIFHAVGKVVFGSKEDDDERTISKVLQDFGNRSSILKLSLIENYTKFNKSNFEIETLANISEDYSFADTLNNGPLSLEYAIRSTRVNFNQTKLGSTSDMGLTFPREWKVHKAMKTTKEHIDKYIEVEMKKRQSLRNFNDSNLYHGFFEPLINKQRAFRNKAKLHYLLSQKKTIPLDIYEPSPPYLQTRLGGLFKEIHGDEHLVADNDDYNDTYGNDEYFKETSKQTDNEDSGSEFEDDPIIESEDEIQDDTFGDDETFERELIAASQNKKTLNIRNAEFFDDFNDDDDFSE